MNLQIIQYSEKAIAVFGSDTKTIKDELGDIGGRFNRFLTNPTTGNKECGWIFQIKKLAIVTELVNKYRHE